MVCPHACTPFSWQSNYDQDDFVFLKCGSLILQAALVYEAVAVIKYGTELSCVKSTKFEGIGEHVPPKQSIRMMLQHLYHRRDRSGVRYILAYNVVQQDILMANITFSGKYPHLLVQSSGAPVTPNIRGEIEALINFGHVSVGHTVERWIELHNLSPVSFSDVHL